jgi:hypothetical protein
MLLEILSKLYDGYDYSVTSFTVEGMNKTEFTYMMRHMSLFALIAK